MGVSKPPRGRWSSAIAAAAAAGGGVSGAARRPRSSARGSSISGGRANVIVRPDVYERYRATVRGEPFLWVEGKLAKDDGAVNVLAESVSGLRCGTQNAERGTDRPNEFAFL